MISKSLRVAMKRKNIRRGKASNSRLSFFSDAATKSFEALMRKNAAKYRFEGLDEGDPPPSLPHASKKKLSIQ